MELTTSVHPLGVLNDLLKGLLRDVQVASPRAEQVKQQLLGSELGQVLRRATADNEDYQRRAAQVQEAVKKAVPGLLPGRWGWPPRRSLLWYSCCSLLGNC